VQRNINGGSKDYDYGILRYDYGFLFCRTLIEQDTTVTGHHQNVQSKLNGGGKENDYGILR